tara:strand:- start:196 stop:780 length:585 start_codon:yes stop_codon:yes gene_type:complete
MPSKQWAGAKRIAGILSIPVLKEPMPDYITTMNNTQTGTHMAYYKQRKPRKETTAQSLARYKRKQAAVRKKREMEKRQRELDLAPGGRENPLTPKWCSFEKYSRVTLQSRQQRYRGTTSVVAYLKGTEPIEHTCAMTGHRKRINIQDHQWAAWISRLSHVQFGKNWYDHPVSIVSYAEFCNRYVVYEEHSKYLD